MELSDSEISLLHDILTDKLDDLVHEPHLLNEEDTETFDNIFGKVYREAKARGFWWAR